MTHLDLFSGIGGFALAVDEVWPGAEHIFCEIDPYCQALLKKRFERSVVYGDIRQLTADTLNYGHTERHTNRGTEVGEGKEGRLLKLKGENSVDILTGGFPCQPFSQAGKRRGTEDNRYLWPEMLRVIKEFSPRWVIAENVRGLINISNGVVFGQVLSDLENAGYEVQAFVIPAVAVNAPHRRDRVWIVAHKQRAGQLRKTEYENDGKDSNRGRGYDTTDEDKDFSNAPDTGQELWREGQQVIGEFTNEKSHGYNKRCREAWNQSWLEVATELCGVDDGLPAELDGLKLSKSRHRVERLKALGNAIVPQVAAEIMKAIKLSEGASPNDQI